MRKILAIVCLLPAVAQSAPHEVTRIFQSESCSEIIAAIDSPNLQSSAPEQNLQAIGNMAMTFGFLLGYEAANGPLNGNYETVLMNFRAACLRAPEKTGIAILQDLAVE